MSKMDDVSFKTLIYMNPWKNSLKDNCRTIGILPFYGSNLIFKKFKNFKGLDTKILYFCGITVFNTK